MSSLERKTADYNLAKLEAEFVARKQAGTVTKEERDNLRAIRRAYRLDYRVLAHEGAHPAPIGAKTIWQKLREL